MDPLGGHLSRIGQVGLGLPFLTGGVSGPPRGPWTPFGWPVFFKLSAGAQEGGGGNAGLDSENKNKSMTPWNVPSSTLTSLPYLPFSLQPKKP